MEELVIRPATFRDAGAIAEAHIAAWRVAYRGIIPDEYLDGEAMVIARHEGWARVLSGGQFSDGRSARVVVPEIGGRVVGFADAGPTLDTELSNDIGELHGFYLHPDVWGSGVADSLVARAHQVLSDNFAGAVLWVLTDNSRARRFYERSGWTCGEGAELVTDLWNFSPTSTMGRLQQPIPEVQYRISF